MSASESIQTEQESAVALPDFMARENARLMWRRRVCWIAITVVLASVAFVLLRRADRRDVRPSYETEPITVGAFSVKVSVTGTLKPTNNVEVGSELSGLVTKVLVEENDRVKKGDALAELDGSKLNDAVARSRAALAAADAQVLQSEATVLEARATLDRYEQVSRLSGGKVPSRAEMDAGRANLKRAEASAAIARANVPQASAALRSDETNVRKATIRSPIDGVVLTRKVDPGQTVAATLQAPVMFTIAEDLRKMELKVDVDEADVGQVKIGQSVTFTVDAWPGRIYAGVVTRIAYGSQTKDDVVSYPAVIAVDNRDLSLRPGMTATADIETIKRGNALLVPNAALRFTLGGFDGTAPEPPKGGGLIGRLMPGPPPERPKVQLPPGPREGAHVWVVGDRGPMPIAVSTGATDGRVTELLGAEIAVGTRVITDAIERGHELSPPH